MRREQQGNWRDDVWGSQVSGMMPATRLSEQGQARRLVGASSLFSPPSQIQKERERREGGRERKKKERERKRKGKKGKKGRQDKKKIRLLMLRHGDGAGRLALKEHKHKGQASQECPFLCVLWAEHRIWGQDQKGGRPKSGWFTQRGPGAEAEGTDPQLPLTLATGRGTVSFWGWKADS